MKVLYTARAVSSGGGRNGHTRTADGQVDLDRALPAAMGGTGKGANPEKFVRRRLLGLFPFRLATRDHIDMTLKVTDNR